eukprot:scaffold22980_cov114-Isochrysis_galbana.AAC.3
MDRKRYGAATEPAGKGRGLRAVPPARPRHILRWTKSERPGAVYLRPQSARIKIEGAEGRRGWVAVDLRSDVGSASHDLARTRVRAAPAPTA